TGEEHRRGDALERPASSGEVRGGEDADVHERPAQPRSEQVCRLAAREGRGRFALRARGREPEEDDEEERQAEPDPEQEVAAHVVADDREARQYPERVKEREVEAPPEAPP